MTKLAKYKSVVALGVMIVVLSISPTLEAVPIRIGWLNHASGGTSTNLAAMVANDLDPGSSATAISAAAFDAMSPAALRAAFDVLLFGWTSGSSGSYNADWSTRIKPYLALGGGVIWEDPGEVTDLAASGITFCSEDGTGAPCTLSASGAMTVTAMVPGLTDGITGSMANNHINFSAWNSDWAMFLRHSGGAMGATGLYSVGPFGGRMVVTGPDQFFHGARGAGGIAGNQYNLALNEVLWVAGGSRIPAPGTLSMFFLGLAGIGAARRRLSRR